MGEAVRLTGADGSAFEAWRESPREARRGGLVVLHGISGVTPDLRALAAEWAGEGWEVLVPSLPERADPVSRANNEPEPFQRPVASACGDGAASVLPDVQAAVDALRASGPVCVLGFGSGGTAAWLVACRGDGVTATAAFHGGHIVDLVGETPRGPVVLHFRRHDAMTPPVDVARIRDAHPDVPVHVYEAGQAFVGPKVGPDGHEADSARLAMLRTRAFFHRAVGGREHGA